VRSVVLALCAVLVGGCRSASGRSTASVVMDTLMDVAAERRAARRRHRRRHRSEPTAPPDEDELRVDEDEGALLPAAPSRPPLPLYPPGLAVDLGPEDITCIADADCVVFEGASCCSCADGGVVVAVRAERVQALRAARDCAESSCSSTEPSPSCRAAPVCLHGLCRLIPPEPIPPPPPSPATGPLEIPPGYRSPSP